MATSEDFEETLSTFTHGKTGEKVYLDLSQEHNVILRPLSSRGSITLGAFWVKLIQHPNNYPVYTYPYKKLFKAGHNSQLQLHTESISITINLVSGQMTIKGQHVIDWFIKRFPEIMEGYSKPVQPASKMLSKQYSEDEILQLQYEREKIYKDYCEKWPVNVLEETVNIMDAGKGHDAHYEHISTECFLDGVDLETHYPIADLLSEKDTKDQLERLAKGKVVEGSVLYRLWRSTLKLWLADKDGQVFIVTPYIDCDRLTDICNLFLQNKLTACIDTICIPMSSLYGNFAEVRGKTMKRFPAQEQVIIEYKIYNAVVYPLKDFTTSFIAIVKEDVVYILQTNTMFDRSHFITSKCTTAEYLEVDKSTFYRNYVDPIIKAPKQFYIQANICA